MRRMIISRISALFALSLILTLSSCGGSGSDTAKASEDASAASGLGSAKTITGTVYSMSGDPISGVTIYLPGSTASTKSGKATRSFEKAISAADGMSCEDPLSIDNPLTSTCSGTNGTFTLDTSTITGNPIQIVFQKGTLRMIQPLSCSSDPCTLNQSFTTFGASGSTTVWPKVAVVTGDWDSMESVLAKLADSDTNDNTNGQYGRVGLTSGKFVYGSEMGTNLTILDANGTTPEENADSLTYHSFNEYLSGVYNLVENGKPVFDVIFINCGANDVLAGIHKDVLQDYVNAGGRLYVTDLAYDFIEQAFPQFMKFFHDPDDANTPGTLDDAEWGTAYLTVDATVNDSNMKSWLKTVSVNGYDASTPGNPDDDYDGSVSYVQTGSALKSNDLIPIGDFLGGWAKMEGPHSGYDPTIWISSGTGVNFDGKDNRPLTASMDIGSNGGKIIYSSYHTANSSPTLAYWSQERVLQYLIFDAF